MRLILILIGFALAACEATTTAPVNGAPPKRVAISKKDQLVQTFRKVVSTVEPVAERECRARSKKANCDFTIVLDTRARLPANAFQTIDNSGRPIIGFTIALLEDARNEDEIAFVMGHEAAHHIKGHIQRQQASAIAGAIVSTRMAILLGADDKAIRAAQKEGAFIGSRVYAKDFELEADALGTVITKKAGYDPLLGAQFFFRIPDPGDQFLGTHPPNAQRLATVRRVAAGL